MGLFEHSETGVARSRSDFSGQPGRAPARLLNPRQTVCRAPPSTLSEEPQRPVHVALHIFRPSAHSSFFSTI